MAGEDLGEIGQTGLRYAKGAVNEEFIARLKGPQGRKSYREMASNDPVIGGILMAFEKTIARLDWHMEVGEDALPSDQEAADFIQTCLDDMSESWDSTLSGVLSCMVYGWSYHEIVYKIRGGPEEEDPTRQSKFTDGRIGWRKFPIRAQESLHEWTFDESGGLQAMVQVLSDGTKRTIPIEKALLFRTNTAKGSPEGVSLLRNAYRAWFYKKRIEEIEAIGIERDLAGLPVGWIHPKFFSPDATQDEIALRDSVQTIVQGIKRNEMEGILFPLSYDDKGNKVIDLTLMSSGGSRQFDTDKIIDRYNQQIAMSVMADFIMLGHDNVGTQSLGTTKVDLWMMAVEAIAKAVQEVINTHAIPRLLRLNGMITENPPHITFGSVETVDLGTLGSFIKTLADAGLLTLDPTLEDYVRDLANLPPADEEMREAAAEMLDAQQKNMLAATSAAAAGRPAEDEKTTKKDDA